MESYKQIAKEAGVSIESVRELMARACVKRVEMLYYRTVEDGRKVDVVKVFYAVYADHCRPAPPLSWELGTLSWKRQLKP